MSFEEQPNGYQGQLKESGPVKKVWGPAGEVWGLAGRVGDPAGGV